MGFISIALIDDQPLIVEGFKQFCRRVADLRLIATANCTAKLAGILEAHAPNLIVVDVANPANRLDDITQINSQAKIVAFTASPNMKLAIQTLNSGAHGYILKQSSFEELSRGLHSVARGEKYVTHSVAVKLIAAFQELAAQQSANGQIKFSAREWQILRLLLDGKTNKGIAGLLSITENTVKHYVSILMQKLNARNRVEVVIAAQKLDEIASAAAHVH